MSASRSGELIGSRYRLGELLGSGGMGIVYDAIQEDIHRRVAVKLLHPHIAKDTVQLERFRREAIAAAELGHANIVQVTDLQIDLEGESFMVMERLEGESLDSLLAGSAPLEPSQAAFIGVQLLSALDAAHHAGIVHRDLKPENVFLTSISGLADVVKLLDFGIAKLTDDDGVGLTGTGVVIGTPSYMAPEQASGEEVDARADLYAVGGILFATLTGRPPHQGKNYRAIFASLLTGTIPQVASLRPDLDPAMAEVVDRALSLEPGDRFPTARAMREALEPFADLSLLSKMGAERITESKAAASDASSVDTDPFAETTATPSPGERSPTDDGVTDPFGETAATPSPSEPPAPEVETSSRPLEPTLADTERDLRSRGLPPWAWLAIGAIGAGVLALAGLGAQSLFVEEPSGDQAGVASRDRPSQPESARVAVGSDAGPGTTDAGEPTPPATSSESTTADASVSGAATAENGATRPPRVAKRRVRAKAPRGHVERPAKAPPSESTSTQGRFLQGAAPELTDEVLNGPADVLLQGTFPRGFTNRPAGPIRRTVGKSQAGLRRCLARSRSSVRVGSSFAYDLVVTSDGRVTSAAGRTGPRSAVFNACMIPLLRGLRFPAENVSPDGATVRLDFLIRSTL